MNKIKSALVSVVLMGLLAVILYILGVGDIFKLDLHKLLNVGVMAILTGIVSLIKSYGTSEDGKFAGIQIK